MARKVREVTEQKKIPYIRPEAMIESLRMTRVVMVRDFRPLVTKAPLSNRYFLAHVG